MNISTTEPMGNRLVDPSALSDTELEIKELRKDVTAMIRQGQKCQDLMDHPLWLRALNPTSRAKEHPLHAAIRIRRWDLAHWLLDQGCRSLETPRDRDTNLMTILEAKEPDMGSMGQDAEKMTLFSRLLGLGIDVNRTNGQGDTALFYAVYHRNDMALSLLVDRKANVSAHNKLGNNIVHALAYSPQENSDFIKKVVNLDPTNCTMKNNQGDTPLATALLFGNKAVVKCLLELGEQA